MDYIFIKDLLVKAIIGIYGWERETKQDILINIQCFTDTHMAAELDEIEKCINYELLTNEVKELVEKTSRFTLEALSEDIANVCLSYKGVLKTIVKLEKPGILPDIKSAGIQIERP